MLNAWLTPNELGSFTRETTLEIRNSLSIQDTPRGVRGTTEPTPQDLIPTAEEYRLTPGDVVNVFIFGLRQPRVESGQQSVVDTRGMINLPVLGWHKASGLTAAELEQALQDTLSDRDIIHDAEVLVQFAAQRGLTYTIFGNETLAVRLNRGPGVFPIPRPDFRLLDALSVSGGLAELVSEIYVFRSTERDRAQAAALSTMQPVESPVEYLRSPPEVQEQESPVPPAPPLPSASFTASYSPSAVALASLQLAQFDASQPPPPEVPSEGSPPEPAEEEVPPQEGDEEAADIQEIMDLMLSPPAESAPADDGPTQQPPATEPVAGPPQPPVEWAERDRAGAPAPWIFLNGEWIEATPDTTREVAPPVILPEEEAIAPAIDWESLAEEQQDIRIIRISPDSLRQGDPRHNIVVRAGDVVRLFSGDIGFYYMTGHVRRPGVYTFRSGATITLKNAAAAAGGLDALGWPNRVTVYRRVGDREQMLQVNLDRIYAGLDADFYLKKDDIVNVGTHPFAPFLLQIRNFTIPQAGGSITYFYRFIRQEVFFRNENLDAPTTPGLFP